MGKDPVFHMGFGDGHDLHMVLMLFPSAFYRIIAGAQAAKEDPALEYVTVILHGEEPLTLKVTLPRAAIISIADGLQRQIPENHLH